MLASIAHAHPPNGNGHHAGDGHHAEHHQRAEHPRDLFTTRDSKAVLPPTVEDDAFTFVIYGDRTGGVPAGLQVLRQAVSDTKLVDPDLVMTVGDLIQGYNETPAWKRQAAEFKSIMGDLPMPWYPVAGNHDIYWRGPGDPPPGHHESNYESEFGPLWYSFRHKNAGFIVLYSDEGDATRNDKGFDDASQQQMSESQMRFLADALERLSDADHVFVFLHHPRWISRRYAGSNWNDVHQMLAGAGNVSAVFAGHIHRMRYGGVRDGIAYYTLATTGGHLDADIGGGGFLHHFNLVTVRPETFRVASIPVGAVLDPSRFDDAFVTALDRARGIRAVRREGTLAINDKGWIEGTVELLIDNPTSTTVGVTMTLDIDSDRWLSDFDHAHFDLEPETSRMVRIHLVSDQAEVITVPTVTTVTTVKTDGAAVDLPPVETPLPVKLDHVPADYFADGPNAMLRVAPEHPAARVADDEFELPDGPLTLEAWVRPAVKPGFRALVSKTQSSEYALDYDEGLVEFSLNLDGRYVSVRCGDPISTDRMTHVAGVFDGSEIRLYVDGALAGQKAARGRRKTNRLPLWIGADPDRAGEENRPINGWIDEVRLSRSAVYEGNSIHADRRLKRRDDTVLLFHLDRRYGPFDLSDSAEPAKALFSPRSKLVPAP